MNIDSDDLLARIRQDFPVEFELAQLRLLVDLQQVEIQRLSMTPPGYSPSVPRPYLDEPEEARHG